MKNAVAITDGKPASLPWPVAYFFCKLGFFATGVVIIYTLIGLLQTNDDTNFLKQNVEREELLEPNLSEAQLGASLGLHNFSVTKKQGTVLYFTQGQYDTETGLITYTTKDWYSWVKPFVGSRNMADKKAVHFYAVLLGIVMLLVSVSVFWMFKERTKLFRLGLRYTAAGAALALVVSSIQ